MPALGGTAAIGAAASRMPGNDRRSQPGRQPRVTQFSLDATCSPRPASLQREESVGVNRPTHGVRHEADLRCVRQPWPEQQQSESQQTLDRSKSISLIRLLLSCRANGWTNLLLSSSASGHPIGSIADLLIAMRVNPREVFTGRLELESRIEQALAMCWCLSRVKHGTTKTPHFMSRACRR